MENSRKKILLLITQGEIGGAQVYVRDLALNLADKKFNITIGHGEKANDWLGQQAKKNNLPVKYFKFIKRSVKPFLEILGFFEIYKYLKKNKFDIVHLNSSKIGILGSLAARCAGIKKIIFTCHGWAFDDPRPAWEKWLYKKMYKIMSWFTDTIICVSDYALQAGLDIGINKKKLITIHNSPDFGKIKLLNKQEAKNFLYSHYNLPDKQILIGTIANFYPTKGLIYLLKAADKLINKENKNLIFCLIGRGKLESKFREFIKANNLEKNIFLLNNLNNAARYLKAFDLFVLPSVKECLPYVLFEAMHAGLPIVATDVGGNKEVLKYYKPEQYFLIPPKNPEKIAEGILKTIKEKPLDKNEIDEIENKISIQKMIEKTIKTYLE